MAVLYLLLGSGRLDADAGRLDSEVPIVPSASCIKRRRRSSTPTGSRTGRRASSARRRHRRRRRRTSTATATLDAGGCVVAPGLVDLHAHLREPGQEEAETIETGAAGRGARRLHRVVAMPNTDPADRQRRRWSARCSSSGATALCDVHAVGRHHRRPGRRAARADGRAGRRSACGSSPTTAPASRTPASCAGRSSTRRRCPARCSPSTARTRRSPAAGTCTRGSGRAGSASPASRPRPRS